MKFSGKVQKNFWNQPLGLDEISHRFVSFMNKIFCSTRISKLPCIFLTLCYSGAQASKHTSGFDSKNDGKIVRRILVNKTREL